MSPYRDRYKLKELPSSPGPYAPPPSPGLTGRPSYSRASAIDREAAAYGIPAFAGDDRVDAGMTEWTQKNPPEAQPPADRRYYAGAMS